MTEKPDGKEIPVEAATETLAKAGNENAVADDQGQKRWSEASATSHQDDKTPSRLDLKVASSPLELVDHTDTGSQRVLVSSAIQRSEWPSAKSFTDKVQPPQRALSAVSREDLSFFSKNDLMAAGLLRDLDAAALIADAMQRTEREAQILKVATQTYGRPEELQHSFEAIRPVERQHSESGMLDTQQIKTLSAINETALATSQMMDALNSTQLTDNEKQKLRTELKSSFTKVYESDSAQSIDGVEEIVPQKLENGAFALGAKYVDSRPNSDDRLAEKLGHFAEALYKNAVKDITDPKIQADCWQAQQEKFFGIGIGLNDAKESIKLAATSAFNGIADGTVEKFLLNPKTYEPLAKAAEAALQKIAENPNATNEAFMAAMNAVGAKATELNESYSKMSPRDQGRVIGNVMFAFINPEGSLEAPQVLAKAGARGEAAVAKSFAVMMKSGTAEEIVQNLKLIRDLAKAPETHQYILDSISPRNNGLEFARATAGAPAQALEAEIGSFNAMATWDDFLERLKSGLRGGKPSSSEIEAATAEKVSNILELKGDKFIAAAVEHMVEKPLQTSGEAFEHWQQMREVLKAIPEVDLRTSLEAGYKFSFPNLLSDVNKELASGKASNLYGYFHDNLPALTDTEKKVTYIPRMRVAEYSSHIERCAASLDMAGVVRHEIGQQLCHLRGWREQRGLFSTFIEERNALIQNAEALPDSVRDWFSYNQEGAEYAFEQTTTDLYAVEHGGLGGENAFEENLRNYFPRTLSSLKRENWHR